MVGVWGVLLIRDTAIEAPFVLCLLSIWSHSKRYRLEDLFRVVIKPFTKLDWIKSCPSDTYRRVQVTRPHYKCAAFDIDLLSLNIQQLSPIRRAFVR